jgi:CRISPR/Cas system-associated protein Cas10 (large subunit of type III CRISPR-Cas system)
VTATTTRPAKVMCEWCGSPFTVEAVAVRDRQDDRCLTLKLCEQCREGRGRTWRLRYEERS